MSNNIIHVERKLISPVPIGQLIIDGLFHEKIGVDDRVTEIDMSAWVRMSSEIREWSVDDREYLTTHYVIPPEMVLKTSEVYCNDVEFVHEFVRGRESEIELPVDHMKITQDRIRKERNDFYFAGVSHSHGKLEGLFSFEDLKPLFLSQKDMNFGLFVHLLTPTMDRLIFRTKDTPRYGKSITTNLLDELLGFHVDFVTRKLGEFKQLKQLVDADYVDELTKIGILKTVAEHYHLLMFEKSASETTARRVDRFSI